VPDLLDSIREALADRYAVERELGRGGMATVFLAQDLKHHRSVAIKIFNADLTEAVGASVQSREQHFQCDQILGGRLVQHRGNATSFVILGAHQPVRKRPELVALCFCTRS